MTSPPLDYTADLEALKATFENVNAGIGGLPWLVEADGGKPILRGRTGLIAKGYIATWEEFDLIAMAMNLLPALLADNARKDEVIKAAAVYLDTLGDNLLRNDADMLLDECRDPKDVAAGLRQALSGANHAER